MFTAFADDTRTCAAAAANPDYLCTARGRIQANAPSRGRCGPEQSSWKRNKKMRDLGWSIIQQSPSHKNNVSAKLQLRVHRKQVKNGRGFKKLWGCKGDFLLCTVISMSHKAREKRCCSQLLTNGLRPTNNLFRFDVDCRDELLGDKAFVFSLAWTYFLQWLVLGTNRLRILKSVAVWASRVVRSRTEFILFNVIRLKPHLRWIANLGECTLLIREPENWLMNSWVMYGKLHSSTCFVAITSLRGPCLSNYTRQKAQVVFKCKI